MEPTTGKTEGRRASVKALATVAILVVLAIAGMVFNPPWLYDWIKVLHVAAVISWMVGLFYLPRLFVYHSEAQRGSEPAATFEIMERRLIKVIMGPAMMVSWLAGLWLAWDGFAFVGVWLWLKLAFVVGLTVFHVLLSKAARRFAAGENSLTARQWRMMNEVPTVLMLLALIMVVVKPFG